MTLSNIVSVCVGAIVSVFTINQYSELPYVRYYEPTSGVKMAKVNSALDYDIRPYVTKELTTVKSAYNSARMYFMVNGGFFDPNNGKTASYVVIDKKVVLDPHDNESLMTNSALKPYMDRILNRGEFRVLTCSNGKKKYDIAYHNDAVEKDCQILHSIQAGPILDERMDLEKEYFVVKKDGLLVRDSISATKKVARSAIAIKDNDVYVYVVTDKNPMTIQELSDYMKSQGMQKALAFDGGSSTSFENDDWSVTSVGDGMGRKVKSFLIVNRIK